MIISQDNHPKRQLYYLGAKTIEVLKDKGGVVDFFDAFKELKEKENISILLFTLTLDWLYLLGAIKTEKGQIQVCS